MTFRKTLLVSTFDMDQRPWSGVLWEWAQVISSLEEARVIAPQDRLFRSNGVVPPLALRDRLNVRYRRMRGHYVPRMEAASVDEDVDLMLYTCQFVYEIPEIDRIRHWRERAGIAVIFLLESWSSTFESSKETLRLLDRFDHVFVMNASSMERLAHYTSTPITQLSTATDTLLTAPHGREASRNLDLVCLGRRDETIHRRLVDVAEERDLLYLYDVWRNQSMRDSWAETRRFNAELIKRSRYYLAWDPGDPTAGRHELAGQDRALSTRYFEGTAGGALVLGSAPDCPEYHEAFDWPDALIPIDRDIGELLAELEADPQRVARARRLNVANALARHDWAHRWQRILDRLGLPLTDAHQHRLHRLAALAAQVERGEAGAHLGLVGRA